MSCRTAAEEVPMTAVDPRPLTRRSMVQASAAIAAIAAASPFPSLATGADDKLLADDAPIPDLVAGNTAFAFDLHAELRRENDGNLLVSPYSVSTALAMTYAGAGGETAIQMAEALSFTLEQPTLHEAFHALTDDLVARGNAEADPDTDQPARGLRIANALWGEQTYPFSPDYAALLEEEYGAGLQEVDFIDAPEDAREEINDWVADQTEDRILNIVSEGAITTDTRLVLANAIWFSGAWAVPFDPESTEDADFYLLDFSTVPVPFMFQHEHLAYLSDDGYEVIELPYAGGGFAFTIFLPGGGEFAAFEDGLDVENLGPTIDRLVSTDVRLYLPRFTFEFAAGLVEALQALGMTDAFDENRADFTGMVDGTPPEPLFVSDVLHKAFISVDEHGTEAAAATVVVMEGATAIEEEEEPVEVRIDRPFMFVIRDTQTGTLLFLGRVLDPS
jgi:serpin B